MTDVINIFSGIAVIVGGITALVVVRKSLKKLSDFMDDWNGEPDRPGVPGRLGVMQRLEAIESEVKINHGSSLKDAVNRIETGLNELRDEFSDHVKKQA
ncbi:hypothetical protein Aph01nite_59150 [Acrocarpospora phusangensis]|uniref:Uncharacterized protein n=1 Tax=Acrocarpospora phusangensis TaxID=1070424 RepID=A0A919UTP5_9ACTN|nr:hypothetical protein [Acrocarpospora phusangensis]GIH27605.1 hypothetical protein Aph01nite_59150 [Acrocarpospora phusangensis]